MKKNTKLIITLIVSFTFIFAGIIYNSYKAGYILAKQKQIKDEILSSLDKKMYVNINNRSILVNYADLGIYFNEKSFYDYYQNCNNQCVFSKQELINEIKKDKLKGNLITTNKSMLENFVNKINQDLEQISTIPYVSFLDLTFYEHTPESDIRVTQEILYNQITDENILNNQSLTIETEVFENNYEEQKKLTTNLVNKATMQPMLIKYGRYPVYIPANTLKSFVDIYTENNITKAKININTIEDYMKKLTEDYKTEVQLEKNKAILSIAHAIIFRAGGEDPYTSVILPTKGISKTNGSFADKYLEVNKTQQRMYAFEKGKLVNTYIIGTGLLAETPIGEYKILRKEGTAISYVGNWYMPYYMPIGTINGKYFGFHEIPYRRNFNGEITSRDINSMGSPATSGCIQLYNEDAKQLYSWADIGTQVIILE